MKTPISVSAAVVAASAVVGPAHGLRILQTSQESWADLTVRNLHAELTASNHSVVLLGPTKHCTNSGSTDDDPKVLTEACQFGSCPAGANSVFGFNETDPTLQWLNAHPQTCMHSGASLKKHYPKPDSWMNQTAQLGIAEPSSSPTRFFDFGRWSEWSSTAYAAAWAANHGFPGIAFGSHQGGKSIAWNDTETEPYNHIYPKLAARLINELAAGGDPLLPPSVFLAVNFPPTTNGCDHPDKFKWVMTHRRQWGDSWGAQIRHCNRTRLLGDWVHLRQPNQCQISVSAIGAVHLKTEGISVHKTLLEKLGHLWYCAEPYNEDEEDCPGCWGPSDIGSPPPLD